MWNVLKKQEGNFLSLKAFDLDDDWESRPAIGIVVHSKVVEYPYFMLVQYFHKRNTCVSGLL